MKIKNQSVNYDIYHFMCLNGISKKLNVFLEANKEIDEKI